MTTPLEIVNYYADLLILQYLEQPKAYATIQALVTPVIMDQLPQTVQAAFAIETATGNQLDILGQYAGVTRNAIGFTTAITLDDDEFRTLIQVAVAQNSAGSSLSDIQDLLADNLGGKIKVFDNANMQMSYFVNSSLGSLDLVAAIINEGLLPKPMGVEISSIIYVDFVENAFGFRSYDLIAQNVSPYNDYLSYQMDWPWIDYADVIVF